MRPLLLVILMLLLAQPVSAAVTPAETTSFGGLLSDFALSDINSSTSIAALKQLFSGVVSIFQKINTWLKEVAGIDIVGILRTIAAWLVIVIEWLVAIIKTLL